MAAVIHCLKLNFQRLEYSFLSLFGFRHPHGALALAEVPTESKNTYGNSWVPDWLQDNILWAVPKHRRTIQKRWNRKYGHPDYHWKPFVPKSNILLCNCCGGYREAGRLCGTCYATVKAETEEMQEAIQNELKISPVDKEVVVLYKGEQTDKNSEYWKGKRVVEMKKERPPWFSKNLLEPTTQAPATTTDVKPTDLA